MVKVIDGTSRTYFETELNSYLKQGFSVISSQSQQNTADNRGAFYSAILFKVCPDTAETVVSTSEASTEDSKALGLFDRELFAELLFCAKGTSRSLNKFADDCGVSAAHLSRLSRQMLDTPPSPSTLCHIVASAQNGITYNNLMNACGYIDNSASDSKLAEKDMVIRELLKHLDGTALYDDSGICDVCGAETVTCTYNMCTACVRGEAKKVLSF